MTSTEFHRPPPPPPPPPPPDRYWHSCLVPLTVWIALALGLTIAVFLGVGKTILSIETPRTAVDLAFVIERNDAGDVTKIHRFILWSNGDVSFPNIPYYAQLVFSCRDCPKVEPTCPGDIDGDGLVGVSDLLVVQAAWGNCPP